MRKFHVRVYIYFKGGAQLNMKFPYLTLMDCIFICSVMIYVIIISVMFLGYTKPKNEKSNY